MRTRSLSLLALAACGSYTTYQTAEPLPRGHWEATAALGPGVFQDGPGETTLPSVHAELGVRRGLGADTDAGLKLYALGWEASLKHRGWQRDAWSIAGMLAVGGVRTTGQGGLPDALGGHVRAVALFTRRSSPGWASSFGPVVTGSLYLPAAGGHATGVLAGAFGNLAWRLGERWQLLPELSLHHTVSGDVPVDGLVVQLGLGVIRAL